MLRGLLHLIAYELGNDEILDSLKSVYRFYGEDAKPKRGGRRNI
jgi:hypothetical protein